MRSRISAVVLAFLILTVSVLPAAAQESGVDPAKKKDIEQLLSITKADQLGEDMIGQLVMSFRQSNPAVPAEFWQDFKNRHPGDDFTRMLVRVYDQHLTHQEIKDIIAFYQSPTGKKFIASLPQIMQESATAGQQWGRGVGQDLVDDLRQGGYLQQPGQ